MITLKEYLEDPYGAVRAGYNPTVMCCICWVSTWLSFEALRIWWGYFKDLANVRLSEAPKEVAIVVLHAALLLAIPLGAFVVLGVYARYSVYSEEELRRRRGAV